MSNQYVPKVHRDRDGQWTAHVELDKKEGKRRRASFRGSDPVDVANRALELISQQLEAARKET